MVPERWATHRVRARARILLCLAACAAMAAEAKADELLQGVLQLRWGDAPHASRTQVHGTPSGQFEAWLDAGPGRRYRLDAAQAHRAAGDLHAFANRRIAVSYGRRSTAAAGDAKHAASAPMLSDISAIVPVDGVPVRPMAKSDFGGSGTAGHAAGSTRWITVMCRFADVASEPKPRAFFQAQYGDAPGQLGHYWSEVSYGRIDLAGSSAHGWYTLPKARAAYLTLVNGRLRVDLSQLFSDCAALADADVDFRGAQGVNLMFNAELDGHAWGGGACADLDGSYQCTRATWNPPWSFNNLAPLAHEMGHGYGLPHSDNSDGDGDTYDNPWDLMSDAWRNAVSDAAYGLLPKYLGMAQRNRLGWVAPANKRTIGADNGQIHDVMLAWADTAATDAVQLLVLATPGPSDPDRTMTYTLEARRRVGAYDARLAGDAVIIHALEDGGIARSIDADQPAADLSSNEGSMFRVGETWKTPDERHWVQVLSLTATGFLVRVGPRPRAMSTPSPMLVQPGPVAASSVPARATAPTTAVRAPRRAPAHRCDVLPRVLRLQAVCAWLAR